MGATTEHFNIFNTGEESFFTPGRQLADIAEPSLTHPQLSTFPRKIRNR